MVTSQDTIVSTLLLWVVLSLPFFPPSAKGLQRGEKNERVHILSFLCLRLNEVYHSSSSLSSLIRLLLPVT